MKHKIERKKLYHQEDDFVLSVNDIRKAVNALDKAFGISLKNPEIWAEPEVYKKIELEKSRINLAALIVLVNGIVITEYFDFDESGDGLPLKPIGTDNPSFVEDSILKWNLANAKYSTDSLLFRARFISNVLQYIMAGYGDIIKNSTKYCKHSRDENQIVNMKHYNDYIIKFINIIIDSNNDYNNIILKMHEITSYKYKKVNYRKLHRELCTHIKYLRNSMRTSILEERYFTDDMAIYEIMQVAYILATNDTNTKCLPNFKYIEGATVQHDLIRLIEELGEQIIIRNGKKKYPLMFLAYLKASPAMYNQYYKESHENIAIATGLAALSYTRFVVNDNNIDDFIHDMFKKGM